MVEGVSEFAAAVEAVLGRSVEVREVLQRQDEILVTVIRVVADDGSALVAKRGRSFAPSDPTPVPKSAWAFFNECASLLLLADVAPGLAPRVVAVDEARGVLVMEDLDDAPTLLDLLAGNDRARAEQALLGWTRAVARLHVTTANARERFRRLRDRMASGGVLDGYLNIAGAETAFKQACRQFGIAAPTASRKIFAAAVEPRGLIHGDVGGGNELVSGDGVALIDFEVSGLANPMIEAAIMRMLLHQGEADHALPADVVVALEAEYAAHAPLDPAAYAAGCAYLFCLEFGCSYATDQPVDSDMAKSAHRARMLLDLHDRQGAVPQQLRAVAAAIAGSPLPAWPALQ